MIRAVIFDMYETLITHYSCPLYFGAEIAADAGLSMEQFLPIWRDSDADRTTGRFTFEEIIERILRENGCYREETLQEIARKRTETKEEGFRHLHPGILPMLDALKECGIRIGLISNCYSEEAPVIRRSVLFPYFDAVFLSYEQGIKKPDEEIFRRCVDYLQVKPEECVYVGDGGSSELEAAQSMGMKAVQATWYFKTGTLHDVTYKPEFTQAGDPMEVLDHVTQDE